MRNWTIAKYTFIAIGMIFWMAWLAAPEPVKPRKERIADLFSPIDGSMPSMVDRAKADLYDPESIEVVKTQYIDEDTAIRVMMDFRAKNPFGNYVPGRAIGIIDSTGILLEYIPINYGN